MPIEQLYEIPVIPSLTWTDIFGTESYPVVGEETVTGGRYVGVTLEGALYRSSVSGARFEVLPDPNTGCVAYSASGVKIFEILVAGTNVGDITMGNYASGKYVMWDESVATMKLGPNAYVDTRLASVLATAIDASGHFIDSVLDTQTKQILGDFTFGESGAIKMITDANNGLWISPTGILGKKAGATTFAIGIDGSPTFVGSITGSTITGGTIQTATSGQRIRIVSASATSPTQDANTLGFVNSFGDLVVSIGAQSGFVASSLLFIQPKTDITSAYFYDVAGVALTNDLVSIFMAEPTSSGAALSITNEGTGSSLYITKSNTGIGLELINTGATASNDDLARITSYKAGTALKVIKSNLDGYSLFIDQQNASNIYQPLYVVNAGSSVGAYIDQNNASDGGVGLLITQARAARAAASFTQEAVTTTNFKRTLDLNGITIYTSNGTTPNGNLGGNAGDLCFGADSGKSYYCTSGTSWTAF